MLFVPFYSCHLVCTLEISNGNCADFCWFHNSKRLLLSPVRVGAQAVSLVAAKGDTNGNGLPVSPSSSDVQNRVLQAAAKHESQPSDEGSQQDTLLNTTTSTISENVDLSEA